MLFYQGRCVIYLKIIFSVSIVFFFGSSNIYSQDWKCIIYGDTRNDKPEHKQVLQSMITNTPDFKFIINVGDVVDHGDNESEWEAWYNTATSVLGNLGQDQVPPMYMSTPGNHDATETAAGLANWNKYLPGQVNQYGNEGKYFTFDYKNARFIILDSDKSSKSGEQYDMLMEAIQNNPQTWLFVITHRPIFAFGNYSYQATIHELWGVPLYENGCDIIFNGHDHFYLRTKKIELNGNLHPPIDLEKGTVQIVTANGGASLRDIYPEKDSNEYLIETYVKEYGYTVLTVKDDTLCLRHIFRDGSVFEEVVYTPNPKTPTDINDDKVLSEYNLIQNYPNPFNNSTVIKFTLPEEKKVTIHIYNTLGQKIKNLVQDKIYTAGLHSVVWNGRNDSGDVATNGLYIYEMKAGNFSQSLKMVLLK